MEYRTEELAKEFLEEFYRLGRMAQSRTISHSMKGEGATPGELGRALKSSTARVAAALNSLERKNQVTRKTDQKDRRKVLVELTEEGRKKAEECRRIPEHMVTRLMESLGEEDAKNMLHIMKRINEIMPQMECPDQIENTHIGGKHDIEV